MEADANVAWFKIVIYASFAAVGGLVREIVRPEKHTFAKFIMGAIVGVFTGLIVFCVMKYFNSGEFLTAGATGLGGYLGTPLLDYLGKVLRGRIGGNL